MSTAPDANAPGMNAPGTAAPGMNAPDAGGLGGRLPLLQPAALSPAQRSLYEYVLASKIPWAEQADFQGRLPDGRLIGPFNVFLYAPEMSRAFNAWVDAETAHTPLDDDVRQVIILTVGGAWNAAYEVYAHTAVGRQAGLSDAAIRSIVAGREPGELRPEARAAFRFASALVRERAVSDELYAATVASLQLQGVVDMVQLIGLYLATSALLNAFGVPAPSATAPD